MTKGFVQVRSSDKAVANLLSQIDKLSIIQIWLMKAQALLLAYREDLNAMDLETDPLRRGKLIQSFEAHFMSSVSFYLRCFLDQPTLRLHIEQITNDSNLIRVHKGLLDLRHDEFVHWKGVRSNIAVTYSLEVLGPSEIKFAENINLAFSDKVGPNRDADEVASLYAHVEKEVQRLREQKISKLRARLAEPAVFAASDLLNENGESILKRV